MFCHLSRLFVLVAAVASIAFCQEPASPASPKVTPDLSKEAFVFERYYTRLRYENDGIGEKTVEARVKVQSEAGVEQLGLLRFGYNTAFEKVSFDYIRVIKPDGSVVDVKTDSIQDLASEIQRMAPQYTDFREKHVNVPALRPGDIVEYKLVNAVTVAMVPGQFFFEYSFDKTSPILDERLELDVPANRKLTTKFGKGLDPETKTEKDRVVYRWTHQNIPDHETKTLIPDPEEDIQPDVQVSSFQSWSEVAKWYGGLQAPRLEPNEAVRNKVAELTKGLTTEQAKIQAIYNYVSSTVRYLGLSFGVGRFQPHAANETLADQYGDCKDKHTLLASMLSVIGVKADAVLINAGRKLDPDVPSPAQFNHVITQIAANGKDSFADTTTEVAPYGQLLKPLRGKQALLVTSSEEGKLVTTPGEASRPNRDTVEITAKIDEQGNLSADVVETPEGDSEVLTRSLLRRTAEAQWPQILKVFTTAAGLDVDVSKVEATNASDLNTPMKLKFHLEKKQYIDLKSTTSLKLPLFDYLIQRAATPEEKKGPIRLGKQESVQRLRLEIPNGFMFVTPGGANYAQDFVEYHAHYKVSGKTLLTGERVFKVTKDEVPRDRYADYNSVYTKATAEDEKITYLTTVPGAKAGETIVAKAKAAREDVSKDDTRSTRELFEAGVKAAQAAEYSQAQKLFEVVVDRDPKFPAAWGALGDVYSQQSYLDRKLMDKAIVAFKKELENDPKNTNGLWGRLGVVYFKQGKFSDAADALGKQMEFTPDARGLRGMQADVLMRAGRKEEAIAPLEAEAGAHPNDTFTQLALAKAYYGTGKKAKGDQIITTASDRATTPSDHAAIAEALGEANVALDLAEEEAQKALAAAYQILQTSDVEQADDGMVKRSWKMASIWQSAGQVYLQSGNLARAQQYLEAAWAWSQQFRPGELLAEVYWKQGRKEDAARTLASALAVSSVDHPETKKRLVEYSGTERRADQLINQHRLDMQQMRTLDVANPAKLSGSAEFYISIGTGSKIDGVNLYSGDKKMKPLSLQLKKARLELPFPDEQPIHLIRAGILSCFSMSPTCKFVLTPVPNVTMLAKDGF